MFRISDARLEALLAEDVPYLDLTTNVLGIGEILGTIEYYTREEGILCGTEEVERMMKMLDLEVTFSKPSGTKLLSGEAFLIAEGSAENLHKAWKVCLNVFDHYSAVATKTASMVGAIQKVNPQCALLATRKSMPGVKDFLMKAIMVGGAFPHRLGLSETVLVFDHHIEFMGGFDALVEELPELKPRCLGKKLFVEADADQARILAKTNVEGIQLDKVEVELLAPLVKELKTINPHLVLLAAGGINPRNVADYAATGVDAIVTTSLYTAKPLDMSVRMQRFTEEG